MPMTLKSQFGHYIYKSPDNQALVTTKQYKSVYLYLFSLQVKSQIYSEIAVILKLNPITRNNAKQKTVICR